MKTDEMCKKVAREIRRSHFNAGQHSGISARGEEATAKALMELKEEIKKEILLLLR